MANPFTEQVRHFEEKSFNYHPARITPPSLRNIKDGHRRLVLIPPAFTIEQPKPLSITTLGKNVRLKLYEVDENHGAYASQLTGGLLFEQSIGQNPEQKYIKQFCILFRQKCMTSDGRGGFLGMNIEKYLFKLNPELRLFVQKQRSQSQTWLSDFIIFATNDIVVNFEFEPNTAIVKI